MKKQIEEVRSVVENHGWFLVQEYVEARSGTSVDKRIQYQKLHADISKNNFDIIVIKSQNRLMRNTKDGYFLQTDWLLQVSGFTYIWKTSFIPQMTR